MKTFKKADKKSTAKAGEKKTTAAKKKEKAEERKGYSVGIKHGLGVVQTWNKLLKENAKAKKTDEELLDAMQAEFPDREKFQPVARIRSWYNNGRYNLGLGDDKKQLPENRSVPYDGKGEKVKRIPFGGKDPAKAKAAKAKKILKAKKKEVGEGAEAA